MSCLYTVLHNDRTQVRSSAAMLMLMLLATCCNPGPAQESTAAVSPIVPSPVGSDRSPSDSGDSRPAQPSPTGAITKGTATATTGADQGDPGAQPPLNPGTIASTQPAEIQKRSAPDPLSLELKEIAQKARTELDPQRLPNLEVARQRLTDAIANLDRFLNTNPNSRDGWIRFLRLDAIRKELADNQPNPNVFAELEMNMRQNYLGLEFDPFVELRESMVAMARGLQWGSNPEQSIKSLDDRLGKLVELLDESGEDSDIKRNEALGVICNYLYESGQAPTALSAIRSRFDQPNLYLQVREGFINRLIERPISEPSPVRDCILGTSIFGNALLTGNLSADLMPYQGGVSVVLNLNAQVAASSLGYNRGVVIRSTSSSPVHLAKSIQVGMPGHVASAPASVSTNLQSTIHSIQHRLRIIAKLASRKAAQQQPLANSIAEDHLQTRLLTQFNEQVETQLGQLRTRLSNVQGRGTRPELKRIGVPMPVYGVQSASDAVFANLLHRGEAQLASSRFNSPPSTVSADAHVSIHQSAIMNGLDMLLASRTLESSDLDDLVRQFGLPVSPEIEQEANGQIWSITFVPFHPIQVQFDRQRIKITLRVSQMSRGDQSLKQPATVSATYIPTYSNGRFRMEREGELKIDFIGRATGIANVSLRAFLKGKFEETFKPVLVDRVIDIPAVGPNGPKISLAAMQFDRGWMQIGVQ